MVGTINDLIAGAAGSTSLASLDYLASVNDGHVEYVGYAEPGTASSAAK